jgi:hypothetical protein
MGFNNYEITKILCTVVARLTKLSPWITVRLEGLIIAQLVNFPPLWDHNFDRSVTFEILATATFAGAVFLAVAPCSSEKGLFKLLIVTAQTTVTSFITLLTAGRYWTL